MKITVKVELNDGQKDFFDMFNRELIIVLNKAKNMVTEKLLDELVAPSLKNQKSELKINILNLITLTSNLLMDYFLSKMKMQDSEKSVISLKF